MLKVLRPREVSGLAQCIQQPLTVADWEGKHCALVLKSPCLWYPLSRGSFNGPILQSLCGKGTWLVWDSHGQSHKHPLQFLRKMSRVGVLGTETLLLCLSWVTGMATTL